MREIREDLLTLEDVAALLSGCDQIPIPTALKLARVIGTDHRFAPHVERLQAMARQAGIASGRDDWPDAALHCHRDYQRLLDAEDWEHPADVLDPEGTRGISYPELARTAEARARGSEDPRLAEIQQKLERAWAGKKERAAPIRRIVAEILEQEPGEARHMLNQAFVEYRRRRTAAAS